MAPIRLEEIIKTLENYPHVVDILPAEDWDFPEVNYSLFNPEYKSLNKNIDCLKLLLNRRYILDDLDNHTQRDKWLRKIGTDLGQAYYDFAKLGNSLDSGLPLDILDIITRLKKHYIGTNPKFHGQVGRLYRLHHENYDQIPEKEKLPYIQRFKQETFALLQTIAQT